MPRPGVALVPDSDDPTYEQLVVVEGSAEWNAMHLVGYVSWYALPYDWELE